MTESQSLAAPYNIGINERNELGVVSEAARRLAAASVPLLCGTTNSDHLINLLDSVSLLSSDLQNHSQVKHYVDRICFYLERNPNPKLQKKIQQIFPKLTSAYKSQSWHSGAPRPSPRQPRISHVQKTSCAQHVPGPEVFLLRDDEVEKVALLTMADLRDSLPSVACEMASYEAAWRGASGSTAAALKLALTANISQQAENLVTEEVTEPLPAEEPRGKSALLPKARAPRTGREVVDHILSGMLTTQTFIAYLNKPNPTRPYHLVVVPKSKLQPEHFIMSSFGVMHVLPNGDNEVYSLSKWLRNAQIYDHIIEIRFFKHFNLLRHFLRWRINAVLERFERHRNIIENELLIAVPTFGKNLLQIHALIFELMTVPKTSIEHVIPGTLKNFSDTAKKQLQFLIKYLTRFLHYTKQLDSTADQYLTNRLHEATANNRPSPDYLTNPISVQKEKKHMRLQYLQLCRSQHSCLPNYRRSVQFMVQNLVVNFIADSTIHLIGKIEKFIGESSGSLVTINLVYGLNKESNDVIISYPPIEKIETTLSSLLPNIASSVLTCAKEWLPENRLLEPDKVNHILSFNKNYVESLSRYQEVLSKALCEVQEYCREKEWLCEIRAFVRTWKSVDRYKGAQASYIQEVLEKLKFWSQHVESLTTEFDTSNNLFHISCSALYSALQPALGDIYESLVTMVQTEFDERGARLIEETQNKHQMLKAQKAEVSSFAEYAKTLSSVKLNTEELLAEKEYIKSLYGILQKLKIDNPLMAEIDKRLQLQWELYLMVLHDGETFINKEAPAMLQGLDEQIKTLEIEAELILRKISQADSPYCNPNTDQKYIMPLVEDAKKKIAELKETMTTYSDWKFSITSNYHNMQKIQIVQTKVDARYAVWSTLQTVCNTVQAWQDTKFSEFDTISASAQIQTWLQTADYLRSVLPEKDRILTTLDIKIDNVSKFVPLLVQLSSESVKSHHWQEIHICMSEMYDSKQELYVNHLMTSKLLQNKDVISRICGQALTEHTLEQSMVELEQYWENREFTLRKISIPKQNPNKNRKPASESVFILDSEDNIVGQIDDHQVLLQSILASPYVKELHSRAETWLVLLQQLHVIMHLWPVCHTNWLYLTEAYVEGKTDVLDEEDIHILLESDRDFRQLLIVTWEDPLVMSLFGKKSLSNVRELQGDKLILRLETLQRHQESLMRQMGLVVQSTREKIPRLHFLSEEDLLSVLTNADSLATAKHVTTACFPNILDITVEPRMDEKDLFPAPKITHIHGVGGEVVPLLQPVVLSAKLLEWLPQLQAMIVSTLHNMMHYSLLNIERTELKCGQLETLLGDLHVQSDPYSESGSHKKYIQTEGNLQTWLSDYPFQCILTTHNVVFTMKLSQWISKRISYADINSWVHTSYDTLVKALRELNTRCPLSNRKCAALQSLLLQFLAQRDRLNALRTVESLSPTSFAVLAVPKFTISPQLGKFDWLSSMLPANCVKSSPRIDITVSQLTAEMTYDYEYLGRYTRLVITPITERVQFSLVAAITLRQTLAITGPSNSGKFETIKDYANMLGRYCVEYSDTLQPLLLSHLLAGLIQTGCWVVVRMFERSDLLSELGQVLQGIHRGFASLADARLFNEQKCPVIPSISSVSRPSSHEPPSKINWEFQTPPPHRPDTVSAQLNLSSENIPPVPNYLGNIMVGDSLVPASGSFQCILTLPTSQPLPLNLKDSCRAMSMMLPDLDTIILAKLISAGYKFYDHLAVKLSCFITYLDPMVVDLELYTLPIVKSILNFTTSSIQSHESNSEQFSTVSLSSVDETMTQIEEERLLIDAVVSALTPMLSSHQRGLMKQVLQEVFPLSVSHVYNMTVPPRVKAMVLEQFESNKYEVVPAMLDKTLELYHVIQNRKCVIVAGPTGCGKTTMFRILSNAINFMQATEARAQKEMERRVSGTVKPGSFTITPSMSKLGTPQPTEYGSRDPSVMGTAPPSTSEKRQRPARNEKLKGLISKSLLAPQRALNILQKPDIRVDSVMSNNPEVAQIESQKVRTLRLFVNTITFDEFVGSGVLGSEDGVFISMVKKFSSTSSLDNSLHNWILLDGNLKTYMESLLSTAISNHVISSLDASQIRIRDNIQFFVETDSLSDVSPSFITKCGVVIVNASIVGWRQRFRSWLKKAEKEFYLTKSRVFTLTVLMETFIGQMIQFLDVHMRFIIRTDKNHTQEVSALLRWLNVLFTRYIGYQSGEDGENSEDYLNSVTVLIFIMSYVWSFGANIDAGSIEAFSEFVKQQIQESNHKVNFPETGTVFDWCINAEKLRFDLWKDYFADVKAQSSVTFTTTILHETTLHLTELLQGSGVPVLIAGPSSSGKSSFIQNCVMPKLHPTKIKVSHLSTKRALEDSIENRLIQFQRRQQAMATSIIPSLLIEDFNVIPNKGSKTGLQEVLRKVLAHGETYSFKRRVYRNLGSTHLILTCNSVDSVGAGGRVAIGNVIERLSKSFNILPYHEPSEYEWRGIFYPVVLSWLDDFPAYKLSMKSVLATAIVGATCEIYHVLKERLKPVPGFTHCIFDAHSLSQVFQGIFLLSPTSKFRQMRQSLKGTTGPQADRRRGQSVCKSKSLAADRYMFKTVAHLWNHEIQRIFSDRICGDQIRSEIYRNTNEVMKKYFCQPVIEADKNNKDASKKLEGLYSTNLCNNMKRYMQGLLLEDLEELEPGEPLLDSDELMADLPVIASDLIFTKHLVDNSETYAEETVPAIQEKLDSIMTSSNVSQTFGTQTLVSFSRAAKHCARLSRSFMLGGLSMLLGPSGSGRKILAQATAIAHNYSFRHIPRKSSSIDFNEMLRSAMIEANAAPVLLFIEDGWTEDDYADLMYFISEGNHPSLIESSALSTSSYGNVNMDVFYKRVQSQLHVVLSLNCDGGILPDHIIKLIATYPCVLKKCLAIDYYDLWPPATLAEIAFSFLERYEHQKDPEYKMSRYSPDSESTPELLSDQNPLYLGKQLTSMLSNLAAGIHLVALNIGLEEIPEISSFVNPASFLDLLHLYTVMETRIKSEIMSKLNVFTLVNEKISQVEEILKTKRSKLAALAPVLKTAQLVYQGWAEEIKKDKVEFHRSQETCKIEEENIERKQQELSELKQLNDLDLKEVSPVLEKAVEALSCINKADIVELKSYKNPPDIVKFSLEALCVLFDKDTSWDSAVLLLQDASLLKNIANLQKDKIKMSTLNSLKKNYLDDPRFTQEVISEVSKATNSIQAYISGIYKYSTTIKKLKPKQKRYEKISAELELSQKTLGKKFLHLDEFQKSMDAKAVNVEESSAQIKNIQSTMKALKKEVKAAEKILDAVKQKTQQWAAEKEELDQQLLKADGDALLAAGAITYFGPFSGDIRAKLLKNWIDGSFPGQSFITEGFVCTSRNFDLVSVLSTPTELLNLEKQGLPKDKQSIENLLIIRELLKYSRRKILISDPDDQLRQWAPLLVNPGGGAGDPSTVKLSDSTSDVTQHQVAAPPSTTSSSVLRGSEVDLCQSVLAESVMWYPVEEVLDQEQGGAGRSVGSVKNSLSIVTGVWDRGVSMTSLPTLQSDNCILTSSLTTSQLSFKPLSETAVITFKLSQSGITSALLKLIVSKQAPHLNTRECSYARSKLNRIAAMEHAEKSLLDYITTFKGSLLDSKDLSSLIEGTQELISNEELAITDINSRLSGLRDKTEEYRPLANHGAVIVEVFQEINTLSYHYNFKLSDLTEILASVVTKRGPDSLSSAAKVADYKKDLHKEVYKKLQLSMSRSDAGFFPLLLVMKEFLRSNRMTIEEFDLFLNHFLHQFPYVPDEIPNWITKSCWQSLDLLEELSVFKGIKQHMQLNQALYQEYFTLAPVLLEPSPWDDERKLTLAQRALLWLFTRPKDMSKVFSDLIMYELGSEMMTTLVHHPLTISENSPSLIITDSDDQLDAIYDVQRIAAAQDKTVKVLCMLSDSVQGEAEHMIQQGIKYGYWIVLSQCHHIKYWSGLLLDMMLEISEIVANPRESLPKKIHPSFKLILVSSLSSKMTLPDELTSKFSVKTHHSTGSLVGRIEQRAKRFLEVEVPLNKKNVPSQIPGVMSQLHSYLMSNYDLVESEGLSWGDSDLNSTLHLLCHMSQNRKVDILDCVRSLVSLVTYGSKSTSDTQTTFLFSAIDRFLTFDIDEMPPQPSILQFQLASSSLTFKSLPDIPTDTTNTILSLRRFSNSEQSMDISFVINFVLSSLPSAPRVVPSRGHTALSLFFAVQAEHYTKLLSRVSGDIWTIKDVMMGDRTPSEMTTTLINDLSRNRVPNSWEPGHSRGLGRWLSDLADKVWKLSKLTGTETQSEMSGRHSSATTTDLDQSVFYSLSSFTNPRHFILSYLYDWAASNDVALSDVAFNTKVVSLTSPGLVPDNGIYLEGLELRRAGWDTVKGLMYPTSSSAPPFPLPPVLLIPYNKQEEGMSTTSLPQMTVSRIDCAVVTRRGDFVSTFVLPSSHTLNHWTHLKPSILVT